MNSLSSNTVDSSVTLSPNGIITTGWLWRWDIEIDTTALTFRVPFTPDQKSSPHGLRFCQRSRLRQLALKLKSQGYEVLVNKMYRYLHEDAQNKEAIEP